MYGELIRLHACKILARMCPMADPHMRWAVLKFTYEFEICLIERTI